MPVGPASSRADVHATVARDWAVEDDTPYLNESAYAPRFMASIRIPSLVVIPPMKFHMNSGRIMKPRFYIRFMFRPEFMWAQVHGFVARRFIRRGPFP